MPQPSRRVALVVPWRTILKLIAAAVVVWLWFKLVEVVLVVLVALLLAVTLNPIVTRFERRMPRWAATLLVGLMLVAVIGGFLWLTWASLSSQAAYVTSHFDQIQRDMWKKVPGWMQNALGGGNLEEIEQRIGNAALSFARSAASAVVVTVLGFILMLYFLIEGRATRDWLIAFVPAISRRLPRPGAWMSNGPAQVRAGQIAASVLGAAWERLSAGWGAKGPRLYDWVRVPLARWPCPGFEHWLSRLAAQRPPVPRTCNRQVRLGPPQCPE